MAHASDEAPGRIRARPAPGNVTPILASETRGLVNLQGPACLQDSITRHDGRRSACPPRGGPACRHHEGG
eukprot:2555388-Pyramimonas_sp.AAC.1